MPSWPAGQRRRSRCTPSVPWRLGRLQRPGDGDLAGRRRGYGGRGSGVAGQPAAYDGQRLAVFASGAQQGEHVEALLALQRTVRDQQLVRPRRSGPVALAVRPTVSSVTGSSSPQRPGLACSCGARLLLLLVVRRPGLEAAELPAAHEAHRTGSPSRAKTLIAHQRGVSRNRYTPPRYDHTVPPLPGAAPRRPRPAGMGAVRADPRFPRPRLRRR